MPGPIGRSPSFSRPVQTQTTQQTSTTQKSNPQPQTTQRSPTTPNPHLATQDSVGTVRPQIGQTAQQNPSFYGKLVGGVNHGLQSMGFGISPSSGQQVQQNMIGVHNGTMSQATAHAHESMGFGKDAVQSFMNGKPIQGGMEAFGSGLNAFGAGGMSLLQGLGSNKFGSGRPTGTINNFE